jgi:hypothetical protein
LPKQSHPLCSATLKNGQPCQSVATTPVGMCAGHARKAAEAAAAEAAEATGPGRSENVETAAVSAASESDASSSGISSRPAGVSDSLTAEEPVRIESLRAALREGSSTAEVAALMQNMLLDGLRANKTIFNTCTKCGKRDAVVLPDLATRISATRALVEELDGRVKQVSETADQQLDAARRKAAEDLASCTDADLSLIAIAANDGAPESMKQTARELALGLLADRDANPQGWLAERLSPAELEFMQKISVHHYWGSFPESLIELAAEVVAGTS